MTTFYECPVCGEEVEVREGEKLIFCPGECGRLLEVDADAEFVDGLRHDLTKLVAHTPDIEPIGAPVEHIKRMIQHAKTHGTP